MFAYHTCASASLSLTVTAPDSSGWAQAYPPAKVAGFCGVAPELIVALAREIAAAPRAAVYGRIGTCTQAFGTLASWLVGVVGVVGALTGNLDAVGGTLWSTAVAPHLALTPSYPAGAPVVGPPNRVRGARGILGQYPASCLAEEIDTPGAGQIHGLVTLGCNPVLSAPGAARLDAALTQLDCMVSVDLYLNETTRHAHVILPALSPLEQPHWDVWAWPFSLTSGGHYSPTLFDPRDDDPERPDDWRVLARLGAIVGGELQADLDALDDAYFGAMCDQVGVARPVAFDALPQHGAQRILDLCIRSGPFGDGFGSRPGGLTLQAFIAQPDGMVLGSAEPQGAAAIKTPAGRIELAHPHFLADLPRLDAATAADDAASRIDGIAVGPAPLALVSRRHLRSLNSWMHNVEGLVSGKPRCSLQMHPQDAAPLGLQPGDLAEVRSARTSVSAQHAGININLLSPATLVDEASGNAVLNGIPVTVAKVAGAAAGTP